MLDYNFFILIIYIIGYFGWFLCWRFLIGFNLIKVQKLLHLPFWMAQVSFIVNMVLAFFAEIPDYALELKIYSYVEENTKTVVALSLAVAVFVIVRIDKVSKIAGKPISTLFLWIIMWSFLFSILGCLPLFWMPPKFGWLTLLRHLKTVPFFYSLFLLASAIIVFIYEIGVIKLGKS